jgi:putative membrane protein
LADIPLLIGLNWVILVYSVGVSMHQFGVKNDTLRAGIGAIILVILDLLIEPVAIQFDYWSWANGSIPTQNYIAWFVFSFACLLLFNRLKFAKVNPVAVVLVLAQFVFFIALNITA